MKNNENYQDVKESGNLAIYGFYAISRAVSYENALDMVGICRNNCCRVFYINAVFGDIILFPKRLKLQRCV